jgi:hypothetical protein
MASLQRQCRRQVAVAVLVEMERSEEEGVGISTAQRLWACGG